MNIINWHMDTNLLFSCDSPKVFPVLGCLTKIVRTLRSILQITNLFQPMGAWVPYITNLMGNKLPIISLYLPLFFVFIPQSQHVWFLNKHFLKIWLQFCVEIDMAYPLHSVWTEALASKYDVLICLQVGVLTRPGMDISFLGTQLW